MIVVSENGRAASTPVGNFMISKDGNKWSIFNDVEPMATYSTEEIALKEWEHFLKKAAYDRTYRFREEVEVIMWLSKQKLAD